MVINVAMRQKMNSLFVINSVLIVQTEQARTLFFFNDLLWNNTLNVICIVMIT